MSTKSQIPVPAEVRLLGLKQALARVRASPRTYYRHPEILPKPIIRSGRLFFASDEIDALIDDLKRSRDEAELKDAKRRAAA